MRVERFLRGTLDGGWLRILHLLDLQTGASQRIFYTE